MTKIRVLDPTAAPPEGRAGLPPPLDSLQGKRIGLNVHWAKFDIFASQVAVLLRERHGVAATPRMERPFIDNPQMLLEWLQGCDAAIIGLGA